MKHINKNHFSITCQCGHTGMIAVADLIARHGEDTHTDAVEMAARCSRCKTKGVFERFQIIYVGASNEAMRSFDNKVNESTGEKM